MIPFTSLLRPSIQMFGLIMINKEVKGIIMLGHQIQMFGLIMINKEVKGIIMLGHQYKC
jgi:hypothetical protein